MQILLNVFAPRKLYRIRALTALMVLFSLLLMPFQTSVLAQGEGCSTSGPVSGDYTVTVCITKPTGGATLSRDASVTATVRILGTDLTAQKLVFYLSGQYLLTDYQADYTFVIPTTKFADGPRTLAVEAIMRDGFTTQRATVDVIFNNGLSEVPVNTNTFTPSTGTTPPEDRPFVLAATGDGAGGERNADAIVDLMAGWGTNMLLYLGDVYEKGTPTEFHNWYGTQGKRYSRLRAITNPTVGNHEYEGNFAPGYFDYWDNVPNYYSVDAAGWHIISLNSTGQLEQTTPGTPQYDWLAQDLEANRGACTVVYFHHPLYNVGPEGESERMRKIWALLAEHGVEAVLVGHDHNYQRWQPLDGQGNPHPDGVTQFVVGTGGHGIQEFVRTDSRMVAGFDTSPEAFGALRMELNQDGMAYQFVDIEGVTLDSGSIACNNAVRDTTAPETPMQLTAKSNSMTHVDLSWDAATDNVGVTNYDIYRDGELLVTINAATTYRDEAIARGGAYEYQVQARDAAGNVSSLSDTAGVTVSEVLFFDDFESGSLSEWTRTAELSIQKQHVQAGSYALRAISRDTPAYAFKQLPQPRTELYYSLWFKILNRGANTMYLQRFRTDANSAILGVFVSTTGKLGLRNDVIGVSMTSPAVVTPNTWHELQTRVRIDGPNSEVEIWLDGAPVKALGTTADLGATPIGRIQLGDNSRGRIYDIAVDQVALSTEFINASPRSENPSLPVTGDEPPGDPGPKSEFWFIRKR